MPTSSPALQRLEATLSQAPEHAFGAFAACLARATPDREFLAWLRHGWHAFAPGEDVDGLRAALESAGGDRIAALLLFARVVAGAGYPAQGLEAARTAQHRAPSQAAPTFLLCIMMLRTGDPAAQLQLKHCLTQFPHPAQGWGQLGTQLLAMGKKEAALVCFGRGEPGFTTAMRRGLLAKELGRRDVARAAFDEAVALSPDAPRAWFLLGTCAQDDRDFAAAVQAYGAVLALDPTLAEAAVNLGTVLQESGDLQGARAAYRQAVTTRRDTFGRVAQALSTSPKGELWLDLEALRRSLAG